MEQEHLETSLRFGSCKGEREKETLKYEKNLRLNEYELI